MITDVPISTLFDVTAVPTSVPDANGVIVTSSPASLKKPCFCATKFGKNATELPICPAESGSSVAARPSDGIAAAAAVPAMMPSAC